MHDSAADPIVDPITETAETADATLSFRCNGTTVTVPDEGASLLDVLRERLGVRSVKDGCAPQGQCGCCTVLVDGSPRVACVTPVRRVAGRDVTTFEGLDDDLRGRWTDALLATGGSQCGFCTPGIVVRLCGGGDRPAGGDRPVERALAAHLCRCTGWQTIEEAAVMVGTGSVPARRDPLGHGSPASVRATLESGGPQFVGAEVIAGAAGFAADTAPTDALVAVPDGRGEWVVAETLMEARRLAGRVQGRRTTRDPSPPLEVPEGEWVATLRTSWVDPAYLETDAAWCAPGGEPSTTLANGGAFGGKIDSPLGAVARTLADAHGRPVRAVWTREDVLSRTPKRPPVAGGVRADGSGTLRVVATPGIAEAVREVAPLLTVEEAVVPGPPTSTALRAAGRLEASCLLAAAAGEAPTVSGAAGGWARVRVEAGGVVVTVDAGDPLDEIVLRSYCIGAVHMAYSLISSEHLAVGPGGEVEDLTIRSLGVVRSGVVPPVEVEFAGGDGPPVPIGDSVFVAAAAAIWLAAGLPPVWPAGPLPRPAR